MATVQEIEVRRMKGQQIAESPGQVVRIDEFTYKVHSQTSDSWYSVILSGPEPYCACPDNKYRQLKCKHLFAVELSVALRNRIEQSRKIEPLDAQSCLYCYSKNLVKDGVRHTKAGIDVQRFSCKDCGKRFVQNLGFERIKATPQFVTSALQLYFSGESLRNTQKFLALQGVKVSPQTIHNWISKYVGLMEKYLDQITPQLSDTWRADELYLKIKGNMKYLFATLDNDTRFWIAQQVSDTKGTSDIRPLLHESQEVAGKRPETFITDGAANFHRAWKKEFQYNHGNGGVHISHITLHGDHNNNKMESFNGELRSREKVMRSLKRADTPILKGLQIYHNFFRPHMGLNGLTPAEASGIKIEGANPWITLIQNASRLPRLDGDKKEVHLP
jgi:transposase-like protein